MIKCWNLESNRQVLGFETNQTQNSNSRMTVPNITLDSIGAITCTFDFFFY